MLIYAFSVALSSFLLFQIQPLIAKYILPWFGGTAGVWSASLLFFQVTLTAGYAYANWLVFRLSKRGQRWVHIALLGISLVALAVQGFAWGTPVLPRISWHSLNFPGPLVQVIAILLVAVGLPYFLLSTNSTLMQVWYLQRQPGRSPYVLYAVSNLGSLVGLVSYPFLFEPNFTIKTQSLVWSAGYMLFALLVGWGSWAILAKEKDGGAEGILPVQSENPSQSESRHVGLWILISALASLLLLGTTNRITQEIAVIPFLWVIPFAVYLLSFILAFSHERYYNRWVFMVLLAVGTVIHIWFVDTATTDIRLQITLYTVLLFVCAMICHGEMYRTRPDPIQLSRFYLMISIGGAFGGIAVNLIFPAIFKGFWEYQLGLGAVWLFLLYQFSRVPYKMNYYLYRAMIASLGLMICVVFASLCLQTNEYSRRAVDARRNFYGILSVKELSENDPENHRYVLHHGITSHGFQFTSPARRHLPTAYYTEESGIGLSVSRHPSRPGPLRVGLIGLGAGVLAAYGQEGDHFWFYEINPAVVEIAQGSYFSYLRDTAATIDIALGDGRVLLENEFAENGSMDFDLLVLDAFNSDSIPTHLLTRESIELYLRHLSPDGLLAFHISNRFLNLAPVVWGLADAVGMDGVTLLEGTKDERISPSRWIILTKNQDFLNDPVIQRSKSRDDRDEILRIWTDDYSNLFLILK